MTVIIAGAGIGGLTAALCLAHYGHKVVVLERASALREVGAGIQLPPNAMKVFAALGLTEALETAAFRPEGLEARMGRSGRRLFKIPLNHQTQRLWGAPYLHIHRADYIAVLATALKAAASHSLRLGAEVVSYSQDEEGVRVNLADGSTLAGEVLIGADGIHSVIRTHMLGPEQPVFTGNVAWRAVVPIAALGDLAPDPTACVWMGAGRHAVTYRLRGGELANFVGVVERDDWQKESWTEKGSQAEALADFQGWHPIVRRILETTEAHYRWALFDRKPLDRWVDGRVALLGDAAHPMLPFMAQGAAMAVEDGWALAQILTRTLSSGSSVEDALTAYEAARKPRTSRVQAVSRANAKTFHRSTRLSQLATYGPMWLAGQTAPTLIHRRQDWLYGYDVTAI